MTLHWADSLPSKIQPITNEWYMHYQMDYKNALVLPDLSSDVDTRPEADGTEEAGKTTGTAAVSYSLCVLPNGVAWAEVGDHT